jgi:DNA-binding response OmpR family regulator
MNYYEIDYETNYNPKLLSAKISCNNMSSLSSDYTTQQNNIFIDRINMDICNYQNNYNNNIEEIKTNESELLKGFSINKKSCIYKRPEYNNGVWKEQYYTSDTFKNNVNSYKLFDYQTKNKTKVNKN